MDKSLIDSVILKLNHGINATKHSKLSVEILGNNLLEKLIDIVVSCEDKELTEYTLENVILKAPILIPKLSEIIYSKYPQHQEFIDKLIILT